jgi:hypothetical protein
LPVPFCLPISSIVPHGMRVVPFGGIFAAV